MKAQIHAGGRGKAGGVKLAKSPDEAATLAEQILGMKLVTPQTGDEGRIVHRLLIEEGLDIKRELYLSMLVDRAVGRAGFHGQRRGRNGNRGSRAKSIPKRFCASRFIPPRVCNRITRASSRSAWAFRRNS